MPIVLTGISPEQEEKVTHLKDKLLIGSIAGLQHFALIMGKGLALSLGVGVGDKVTIMIPEATVSRQGWSHVLKRFNVAGVFSAVPVLILIPN